MTKMFQNPISPALHGIPENCPICGERQAPIIPGRGIEDVYLDGTWTVAHQGCISDELRRIAERAPLPELNHEAQKF